MDAQDAIRRWPALASACIVALVVGLAAARADDSPKVNHDATITAVRPSGSAGGYTLIVTIRSNDTGMDRYADWWEVVDEKSKLVYRRVLLHDHADEQPFARDGGPIPIKADQVVTVRAHFYPEGYSTKAMRGSVASGFHAVDLPATFAPDLERLPPLPSR